MDSKLIISLLIVSSFSAQIPAQNWQGLSGGTNNDVRNIYSDTINNRLIVSGNFTTAGGMLVNEITYYDGANWFPFGNGAITSGPVLGLAMYQNELYATGNFLNDNSRIAKWDGNNWIPIADVGNDGGGANGLKVHNGLLYAYGNISKINNHPFYRIAAFDGNNWQAVVDSIDFDFMNIADISFYHDTLFIGGNFIHTGLGYESIVKYADGNWYSVGGGFKGNMAWVSSFVEYDNKLVAGGVWYKDVADNPSNSIAQWDGYTWGRMGGEMGGNFPAISDIVVWQNELYAVGVFSEAGGVPAQSIAKWDGTKWCGLGSIFNSAVNSVCVHNNELYIACQWTIDGDTVNHIAKWIGGDYVDTCGAIIGVEELTKSDEWEIYPNPATTTLTIQTTHPNNTTYTIYDITGRLMQTGRLTEKKQIDISSFAEGVYVFYLQMQQGVVSKKFVKQN